MRTESKFLAPQNRMLPRMTPLPLPRFAQLSNGLPRLCSKAKLT